MKTLKNSRPVRANKRSAAPSKSRREKPVYSGMEVLEGRIAPAILPLAVSLSGGVLTIDETDGASTFGNHISVSISGGNIILTNPGQGFDGPGPGSLSGDTLTLTVAMTDFPNGLVINTGGGDDNLTLNLVDGQTFLGAPITFNGGPEATAAGDSLTINGGTQGSVTYDFTNAHDGKVTMQNFGSVAYTGLEPVFNLGAQADIVFNLPAGPTNPATLTDEGATGNGISKLAGGTFESVTFTDPTNSLTINRGNASDTLLVNAPDHTASLIIGTAVAPFASIDFSGALNLGVNKSLDAHASGTIILSTANSDLATSGTGTITLTTEKNISLTSGSSITTVDGAILLSANQQAAPTAGTFNGVELLSATVHATGTGAVTVLGKGGTVGGGLNGVYMNGTALISGGSGAGNKTTVTGFGGTGGAGSTGVRLEDNAAGVLITSLGGNVVVTGSAGGSAGSNDNNGVSLGFNGGTISSGGTGNVTVIGTGGSAISNGNGVFIFDNSHITSSGGNVSVTGVGAATGNGSLGIYNTGVISATGNGSVVVSATALSTGVNSDGILVRSISNISTANGTIQVTGAAAGTNFGINFESNGKIFSGNNQAVTLISDSFNMPSGATVSSGTGTTTIAPKSAGVNINVGGADGAGVLGLSNTELAGFTAGNLVVGQNVLGTQSEDFSGNTLPAGFEVAGPSVTFAGGMAQFNGGGDGNRTNVRTIADNFFSQSFVAEITLYTGGGIAFFGMGDGSPTGGSNEPASPSINVRMHPNGIGSQQSDWRDNGTTGTFGHSASGTHRLRLTWDATTKTAIFEVDENYAGGPFVADITSPPINGADNGLDDTNTRLFFGGADGDRFDDFTVSVGSKPNITVNAATAVNNLTLVGNTITLNGLTDAGKPVTLNGSVVPSGAGVDVNASGVSFAPGSKLNIAIAGATVDTQYQQLNVAGAVDLTGATLVLSGAYVPTQADTFIIVNNDGADAVTGTFAGLPEGTLINVNGTMKKITYVGGTGNDVALVTLNTTDVGVSGGNLIITDSNGGDTNDTLTITLVGANVRVTDPLNQLAAGLGATQINANTVEIPFASISAGNITLNTLGGNDTVTLALAGGDFIPTGGVIYNGGNPIVGPGDRLNITGGSQGVVTYNYTNAHDGSIAMANFGTVTYNGLEPISNTGSASDIIFNLPAGPNTVTLGDDGIGGNTLSRLSGATFEQTDFANPTGTITINRGDVADTLTINALPDLNAGMTIGSAVSPFAAVTLAGAVTLGVNKNLSVNSSGTIALTTATSDIATSGTGTISLTTGRNITLAAGSSLNVVDGALTLVANLAGTGVGTFAGLSSTGGTLASTGAGPISITATGGNTGASNFGMQWLGGSSISSTGGGTVTIDARGGSGAGGDNDGIIVTVSSITSNGNISITGTIGTINGANQSEGLNFDTGDNIVATGAANISLITDSGFLLRTANINAGANTVTLKQKTAGVGINLGTYSIVFAGIPDNYLDSITAGTVQVGDATTGAITISAPLTPNYNFLLTTAAGVSGASAVTLSATRNLSITANGAVNLTGQITVPGTTTVNAGAGAIALANAANDFTGAVALSNSGNNAVSVTDVNSLTLSTVTMGSGPATFTAADLVLSGAANSITGTGTILLQPSVATTTIGIGAGATGAFNLSATEVATLANGFTSITIGRADGNANVDVRAITFNDPAIIQVPVGGTITVNGQITGAGNASITLDGAGATTVLNAGIVTAGNAITISDSVQLGASVSLDATNGGAVAAGAAISVTGAIDLVGNTLTWNSGATATSITTVISGTGGILNKAGGGTLTLSGTNTYTGGTTINNGTLSVSADANLGTGNISYTGAATLAITGTTAFSSVKNIAIGAGSTKNIDVSNTAGATFSGSISGGGAGTVFQKTNTGTLTLTGNSTFTNGTDFFIRMGTVVLDGGSITANGAFQNVGYQPGDIAVLTIQNGGSFSTDSDFNVADLAGSGTVNISGATSSLTANQIFVGKALTGAATGVFNQNGGTVTVLSTSPSGLNLGVTGNSTATYNLNGGTLIVPKVERTAGSGTFNFNGGTLTANAANAAFMSTLTAANVQAGGALINSNGFNITVGQALLHDAALGVTPDGGLTKSGAGVLSLNGVSTYTGPTALNAGSAFVNGSINSSTVTVANLAILGGTGSTGPVNVQLGGTLAPGTSPGTLSTGTVTFAGSSNFTVEVNAPALGSHDQLNVTGTVNLGGATLVSSGTITSNPGQQILLINNDGTDAVNGIFAGLPEGSTVTINGVNFAITYAGGTGNNDVVLVQADTNIVIDAGGNLVIDDFNTASDDQLTIQSDTANGRFVISDPTQTLYTNIPGSTVVDIHTVTIPFTALGAAGQVLVTTRGGVDSLNVNFSLGNFGRAISFDGGAPTTNPGDSLRLSGGTFANVTHTFVDDHSGSVSVTGNSLITYTAIEPISDNLVAANRLFDFTGAAETITLTTSPVGGFDNRIDSTLGEFVDFLNPTVSLEIRTTGTAGADTVNINSVSAAYRASTIITTDTDDNVNLNTSLTLGSATSAGNFSVAAANLITLNGSINTDAVANAGSVTLNGPITLAATVTIDTNSTGTDGAIVLNSTVQGTTANTQSLILDAGAGGLTLNGVIGTTTSLANLTTTSGPALTLPSITLGGNLSMTTTAGLITQVGGTTLLISGTTSATTGTFAITLANPTNNFTGAVSASNSGANDIQITDVNGLILGTVVAGRDLTVIAGGTLSFGTTTVGDDLVATANGAITDTGAISVTATTTLTPGAGNSITLDNANNFGGSVTITNGLNATLNDINGVDFGNVTLTGGLTVTAAGAVTDAGTIIVPGTTSITAGAANNITLNSAANNFGTVSIVSGNNVVLVDTNAIDLGASTVSGTLSVTANGAISDSGALAVTGTATFAPGAGNSTTLDNANNFSTVIITNGVNATLNDINGIDLGNVTLTGGLTVTAAGAVTDSGTIVVPGTTSITAGAANNITLDTATNNFGTVTIVSGNNVVLVDTNAIDLGASTVSGTLSVTANGAITDSGALLVTGAATFAPGAGNSTTLDNANNFSTVNLTNGVNATINDINALDLGNVTLTGALTLTTAGAVTDSGTIVVPGITSITAGAANDITLNTATNNFGTVTIVSGNNVTLVDTNALILGTSTVSGSLAVTTNGALTQSGPLTVATTSTLSTGAGLINLTDLGNNFGGAVTATTTGAGASVSIYDNAGGLAITNITTTNGAVTLTANNGTLAVDTIVAGSAGTITLTTLGAGGSITLNSITTNGNAVLTSVAAITETGADIASEIVASQLTATAATGFGTLANPIETTIITLEAVSTTGGIYIAEATGLTIGAAGGLNGVSTTTSGDIQITTANGGIVINELVSSAGAVTLTATDVFDPPALIHDVTVAANVTAVGAILLRAGDDLITNLGTTISGASVTLIAPFNDTGDGGSMTLNGNISVTGPLLISVPDVNDPPTFGQDITIGGILQSTGGSVTLQAGDDIIITGTGQVLAGTTVTMTAAFGDVDNHGAINQNGLVQAATTILMTARDVITLNGNVTSTAGNITITSTNDDIIRTAGLVSANSATGTIALTAGGADGDITNVNINSAVLTFAGAGTGDVTIVDTGAAATNTDISGTTGSGQIVVRALNGNLNIAGAITTTNYVELQVDNGNLTDNSNSVVTSNLALFKVNDLGNGGGNLGTLANPILTSINQLQYRASQTGNVWVTEGNGLTSVTGDAGTGANGQVHITATTGDIALALLNHAGMDVFLTATAGGITEIGAGDAATEVIADQITLSAGTFIRGNTATNTLDLNVNEVVSATAASGIRLDLRNNAQLTQATNNHTTLVTATTLTGAGDIVLNGSAGSGTRTFVTVTANTAPSNIIIDTAAGDIVLAGNITSPNLTQIIARGGGNISTTGGLVTGGQVDLEALGGNGNIGALATPIQVDANDILTFDGTGAGNVYINDIDGALFGGDTGSGDIRITSTTGDLTINGNVSTTGNVNIEAAIGGGASAGNILRLNNSVVSGNLVTLIANQVGAVGGGIGTIALPVQTAATSIVFTGEGTGNVVINEADSANIQGTTGSGNITVVSTGTGTLTVNGPVTTTTGTVTVTTANGDILRTGANSITGTNVNLTAGGADGDIGAIGNALLVVSTNLNLSGSGTGDILISETGGAVVSATTGSGLISLSTAGGGDWTIVDATYPTFLGANTVTNTGITTTGPVSITTGAGAIIDGNLNNRNIAGGAVFLSATTGIGAAAPGGALETTITSLEAQTNTGGVFINESDALTIGTAGGINGVTASNSNIIINSGALTMIEDITSPLNVTLNATGTITEVGAAGVKTATLLTTTSVGGQTLTGDNTVTNFDAINTGGGDISLINTIATLTVIRVTNLGAGSDVTILNNGAGGVLLGNGLNQNVNVGGIASITANGGSINDGNGANNNITALAAVLVASSGIGTSTTDRIETNIGALEADAGTGGLFITENDAITLGGVTPALSGVAATTEMRITTLNAPGGITIVEEVTTTGPGSTVFLVANGPIVESGGGFIDSPHLDTTSAGGQVLNGPNTVGTFIAVNTVLGTGISLQNDFDGFLIHTVTSLTGGEIFINNIGDGATIDGNIRSGTNSPNLLGGDITVITNGLLTVDAVVDSRGGTGGTLTLANLVLLNVSPIVGFGDITLQGGPGSLTILNPITVTSPLILRATDDVNILAKVETTSVLSDITVLADSDFDGHGGVYLGQINAGISQGSLKSGRNLDVRGSEYMGSYVPALANLLNSIVIQPNGPVARLEAVGDVLMKTNGAGPADAQIWLGALVRSNTSGDVAFDSRVRLISDDARAITHGAGDVIFQDALDSAPGTPFNFRASTDTGVVLFSGPVGAIGVNTQLGDVTIDTALDVTTTSVFNARSFTIGDIAGTAELAGLVTTTGAGTNLSINANTINIGGGLAANAGSIFLQVNNLQIAANVGGSANLTIQPRDLGRSIGVSGGVGDLNLTGTEVDFLQDGFSQIIIGRSTGTGLITIGADVWLDPVTFQSPGATGQIDLVGSLFGNGNGAFNFYAPKTNINVSGGALIDTAGGTVNFGSFLVNNTFVLNNNITLQSSLTIDTDGLVTDGSVYLVGAINGGSFLSINAGTTGTAYINGSTTQTATGVSIGGTSPLSFITVIGGLVDLRPNIRTTGPQTYIGSDIHLYAGDFSTTSVGTGTITFNGPVTMHAATTLTTQNSPIAFNGDVNNVAAPTDALGKGALTLRPNGSSITFNGSVGNLLALRTVNFGSASQVTLGNDALDVFQAGSSLVIVADEVDFAGTVSVLPGGTISIKPFTSGVAIQIGGVESNGSPELQLSAADIAALGDGASMITIGHAAGTLTAPITVVGPVTFHDPVTFSQPNKTSGDIIVNAQLTGDGADGGFIFRGPAAILNANITTAGGVIDLQNGVLGAALVNLTSASGKITLSGTLTGAAGGEDLTVNSGTGDITVSTGYKGLSTPKLVGDVVLTSSGTTLIDRGFTARSLVVDGGGITQLKSQILTFSAQGQTYDDAVQLFSNVTLTNNTQFGTITLNGTVDSNLATPTKHYSLTITNRVNAPINATAVEFSGAIGAANSLAVLRVNTLGGAIFNANADVNAATVLLTARNFTVQDVTTSIAQTYNGVGTFMGTITASKLSVRSTSTITNGSGAWNISGLATITATGSTSDVLIGGAANHFTELALRGRNISIEESGNMIVRSVTATGTLSLTTHTDGAEAGDVDQSTGRATVKRLETSLSGSLNFTRGDTRLKEVGNLTAGGAINLLASGTTFVLLDGVISAGADIVLAANANSATSLRAAGSFRAIAPVSITSATGRYVVYSYYAQYIDGTGDLRLLLSGLNASYAGHLHPDVVPGPTTDNVLMFFKEKR